MWIKREITGQIVEDTGFYIQILIGPRQSGKSSLLNFVGENAFKEIEFDDLQLRRMAENDPALFLSQFQPPLNLDEVQYVPNLFPELKKIVDRLKKEKLHSNQKTRIKVLYRLTGSNIILLSKNVQETLVGRAIYFYLNTLSVSEIVNAFPNISVSEILFKGGLPELYSNEDLKIVNYLNDYISNYVQKDIAHSAGIEKINEFNKVLGLIASRVGQLVNYTDIAKDSGVKNVTVKEWIGILSYSQLVYILPPYESNLNNRLIKSPKIYFWDSGLAVRLQGWTEVAPMIQSPYIGQLFENLVLGEIIKFKQNHLKNWAIHFWRTKEGEEIDFIIEADNKKVIALEAKWGLNNNKQEIPPHFKKVFKQVEEILLVVPAGEERILSKTCRQIPIHQLSSFLEKI
jgi:predicted AAA+ superfamily ATPase